MDANEVKEWDGSRRESRTRDFHPTLGVLLNSLKTKQKGCQTKRAVKRVSQNYFKV